jgi:hypothetical protein
MSKFSFYKIRLTFVLVVLCVPLASCGEGWEMVRVTDVTPYGNSRTAGSGIAYVRAKMLPKKELMLESLPTEQIMIERRPTAVKADHMFDKSLIK